MTVFQSVISHFPDLNILLRVCRHFSRPSVFLCPSFLGRALSVPPNACCNKHNIDYILTAAGYLSGCFVLHFFGHKFLNFLWGDSWFYCWRQRPSDNFPNVSAFWPAPPPESLCTPHCCTDEWYVRADDD